MSSDFASTPRRLVTACPLDCPDGCTLAVDVAAGPDGLDRIEWVGAAPAELAGERFNPFTQNFICAKVRRHAARVHGPRRLRTPLVRSGPKGEGRFREVSWDDALDLVAGRVQAVIAELGPEAIAPFLYTSSGGALAANGLGPLLWRAVGASRLPHTICAATATAAWGLTFGGMLSADPLDVDASALVVVWGANPAVSNTHWLPHLHAARARGAELVVVDPRRTVTARRADRFLAPLPGTDVAVALAAARWLAGAGALDRAFLDAHVDGVEEWLAAADEWTLERAEAVSGAPGADIAWLAERLATRRPALIRLGWGIERNRNGADAYRAVLALALLTGQFGERGGGVIGATSAAGPWNQRALDDAVLGPPEARPPLGRKLNMNTLGRDLLDASLAPPIGLLFVQGANPAASAPNQAMVHAGLAREDLFCVVHDQVLTDTARFADVVLPAVTHFEVDDVRTSYGGYTRQRLRPVIPRVGESRTNDEVAAALAARLGFDPACFDPSPERLLALAGADGLLELRPRGGTVQFRDTFPTHPGGRARLVSELAPPPGYRPPSAEAEGAGPLTLITPATHRTVNSMLGEVNPAEPAVRLSPADAAARGLLDGDAVRVGDGRSSLDTVVRIDPDLRPGVAVMAKGLWCEQLPGGLTANAFAPDALCAPAGGATFNDARVEVSPRG
ncbi:MAG: molybdopterin-dependent oxidoreductase [Acidimicrobiales bacterium]